MKLRAHNLTERKGDWENHEKSGCYEVGIRQEQYEVQDVDHTTFIVMSWAAGDACGTAYIEMSVLQPWCYIHILDLRIPLLTPKHNALYCVYTCPESGHLQAGPIIQEINVHVSN